MNHSIPSAVNDAVRQDSAQSTPRPARRIRVAVLNTHPIQYFAPMYAHMTENMPEIELTVLYCSDYSLRGAVDAGFAETVTWDIDLLAGYRHIYMGEAAKTRTPEGFLSLIVPELWNHIRRGGYDALWLHGYGYAACWVAMFAAKSIGLPVMLRGETHLELSRPGWRRLVRDSVLRVVFKWIDAFLAIGSRNRKYYLASGVPDEKIHLVPYSVDNSRFEAAAAAHRSQSGEYRASLGLAPDIPIVLYASKLIERKHAHTLMRAVKKLQSAGKHVALVVVGSGPMDTTLRELKNELKLENTVFTGFRNQSQLPMSYAAADIFVLASESEPWGLVVNEVMCAGLPVITSPEMGCSDDLVVEGLNGYTVAAGDVDQLAEVVGGLIDDPALRKSMGQRSIERVRRWGYEECVVGLRAALLSLSAGSRNP